MTRSFKLIALALTLGIATAPAAADPDHGPYRGRGWHGHHDGYGNDWRGGRGWRGHRGRRVCHWERHHGRRFERCYWR